MSAVEPRGLYRRHVRAIDLVLSAAVETAALGRALASLDLDGHDLVVRCLGARQEALADAVCEALHAVIDDRGVDLERLRVIVEGRAVPRGD